MPGSRSVPRTTALLVALGLLLHGCAPPTEAPTPADPDALERRDDQDAAATPTDLRDAVLASLADVAPAPAMLGTSADQLPSAVVLLGPDVDDLAVVDASTVPPGADEPADGVARVDVRVAADDDARRQGLMFVEDLPVSTGMVFVFEDERTGGFWMRDTLVALDIAFAAGDGTIRAVLTMEPCGDADPCPVYDPEVAYETALEVPAGWLSQRGIGVGDHLVIGPVVDHDATPAP